MIHTDSYGAEGEQKSLGYALNIAARKRFLIGELYKQSLPITSYRENEN